MVKPPPRISIPDRSICFQEGNSDDISSHFTDDLCTIVACVNRMKDYCGYCDGQFCVEHIINTNGEWCKKKYVCVLCEDLYEEREDEYNKKMRTRIIVNFMSGVIVLFFIFLLVFLKK